MSFVNPILFALGVAFVALPIVLHFLRRRRPPVLWGAMRFLQEAYRRRRRRMTLEQLLLLLCRCALVLLIALLIGRPMFGGASDAAGSREVFLVIDDSIASSRADDDGTALDALKARAAEFLDGLDASAGDRAALITLAGPAEAVVVPPSGDLASVRRLLMGLEPRGSAADLPGAFAIVGRAGADAEPAGRSVVVLSELRRGSISTGTPLPPVPASIERVVFAEPAASASANIAVMGVESLRSVVVGAGRVGGQASVSLARSGVPELPAATVSVELWASGGGRLAQSAIGFEAGQATATGLVWFELPESDDGRAVVLEARLATGDDTLEADNISRRPVDRRRSIEVGLIARQSATTASGGAALERFDASDWVRLALAPRPGSQDIRVVDVRPAGVDGPRLAPLDAAIVLSPDALDARAWSALRGFVDDGGLVVVTPPAGTDVQLWTDAFLSAFELGWSLDRDVTLAQGDSIAADALDSGSGLLGMLAGEFESLATGVGVSRTVGVDPSTSAARVEVRTQQGTALIVSGVPETGGTTGRGLVVYVASALVPSWTDLPTRPLMVPTMQELIRQGVGRARGDASAVAGRVAESALVARDGSGGMVDAAGVPAALPVRDAGVYRWAGVGGSSSVLSVNPDAAGSQLDTTDRGQLEAWLTASTGEGRLAWLDDAGGVRQAGSGGEPVRAGRVVLWLAALALGLAVVETLLARVASRGSSVADLAGSAAGRAAGSAAA